ncbi:MAG: hypothetical protein AUK34_04040 [Ignavibacteria bacterium CG2_30_36_16]|nr:hypothetical protein [Ignavibacteria bacterium]OIP62024.1 MAG: hypothetical protein AUK34_04040 [Ignavibacteria bacterium CG2_30_36_16]PIQ07606.1 MAG: hypothetical protein COW71_16190 [Ignavibacteriales bacterium CG18_big_fil_WC_8_21_14_2_50_31_20]PJB02164.1 MAG: hypothetical protein CO127_00620 [Ignavibacteria bacterium CG_4_9_14_3_um_filter_36_18]
MLVGTNIQKIWDFANKQRFFFKEMNDVSELSDLHKSDIDTVIKIDNRYNELGKLFSGPIFFSHIQYIIPITKKATESFEQLCRMFPEVNRFMR